MSLFYLLNQRFEYLAIWFVVAFVFAELGEKRNLSRSVIEVAELVLKQLKLLHIFFVWLRGIDSREALQQVAQCFAFNA